jgi:hypothetical protein
MRNQLIDNNLSLYDISQLFDLNKEVNKKFYLLKKKKKLLINILEIIFFYFILKHLILRYFSIKPQENSLVKN